jgi:2'-5' RNA ligase
MSRQFIAVVPSGLADNQQLRQLLGKLKRTMSDRKQEARFTPPDLWHVTLQFLGEVPDSRDQELEHVFQAWSPKVADLNLRLQGLGAFPQPNEARVLWIGVQENQELQRLQRELAVHLHAANFFTEEREFKPHLTLARFRNSLSAQELIQLGGRKHFGDYAVKELVLFKSVLQGNIIKYIPLTRKSVFNDSGLAHSE